MSEDVYFRPDEAREELEAILYHLEPVLEVVRNPDVKREISNIIEDCKNLSSSLWIAESKIRRYK